MAQLHLLILLGSALMGLLVMVFSVASYRGGSGAGR